MLTLLSILFLTMIAKLLFVLLLVTRFAMQRIYVDRINWCGMVSGFLRPLFTKKTYGIYR
jgi:hypothetical protein